MMQDTVELIDAFLPLMGPLDLALKRSDECERDDVSVQVLVARRKESSLLDDRL